MTPEGPSPDEALTEFLNPEGTRFTDGDAVQERAITLMSEEGVEAETIETFFREQLERMEHPLDRTVCRHWLRTLAIERGEIRKAAELSEAQIDDLLAGGRPESAASEAATAAAAYQQAGLSGEARLVLSRGYNCLRTARKNPGDMKPEQAAVAQGAAKRLLDDVRQSIAS
ncbi:MAG TPA: hypothetical protein VIF43_02565 [Patescibacteria group bacterium]|jgi:hypothetical protein